MFGGGKNLGMLALAIYLLVLGVNAFLSIPINGIQYIEAALAIAAGVLILLGK